MPETVLFKIENNVAHIIFNRPDKYNAVNRDTAMKIQQHLDECRDNDDIRAVYLSGNGKAFCAGQDLGELQGDDAPTLTRIVAEHYNPIVLKIRNLEKPVICGVNGVAAGAGANIALACDITIAKESATFIQAFSKIGLIPDSGGTYTLPRLIGLQRATALIMLGEKVSARDAEKMGMIYQAVADADFPAAAIAVAEKLAQMPTVGLGYTKRALNATFGNNMEAQLELESQLQTAAADTEDYEEGVTAFLEKRKPIFKGK